MYFGFGLPFGNLQQISRMVKIGEYNNLKVLRMVSFGAFLDDGKEGILLPKRFVPAGLQPGDSLEVFVYHDSEDRLIATTQRPKGILGDIVRLRAVSTTDQGAFLDWGLMKDLFVPRSAQRMKMIPNGDYIVKIILDEQTGRLMATEKIEPYLDNDVLTVKELDEVNLLIYRRTDIGYVVIINNQHTGVLHFSDIYKNISEGDKATGFIKKIYPDNKIDVALGKRGYERVEGETDKIIRLLHENGGFLPYHDKSDPEDIYEFFGMSKKTFKMSVGSLYKQKRITLEKNGIKLA